MVSWPEAWLREAVAVVVPPFSEMELEARESVTVGAASSSVIVTTVLAVVPSAAFVGVPRVTVNVSSGSSTVSVATVTVIVPLELPAAMERLPLETEV